MGTSIGAARQHFDSLLAIDHDECHIWPYSTDRFGYGQINLNGTKQVHVEVCKLTHGPRPQDHEAAHSCGRNRCVNPRHIRWKTRLANNHERRDHGTMPWGERSAATKLTTENVLEIRRRHQHGGESAATIGRTYGITKQSVQAIVDRKSWRHLSTS